MATSIQITPLLDDDKLREVHTEVKVNVLEKTSRAEMSSCLSQGQKNASAQTCEPAGT
jgi:hypothetical protein